jgi:hypothetical protein
MSTAAEFSPVYLFVIGFSPAGHNAVLAGSKLIEFILGHSVLHWQRNPAQVCDSFHILSGKWLTEVASGQESSCYAKRFLFFGHFGFSPSCAPALTSDLGKPIL